MTTLLDHVPIFSIEVNGRRLGQSLSSRVVDFAFDEQPKASAELKFRVMLRHGDDPAVVLPIQLRDRVRVRWGSLGSLTDVVEMSVHAIKPAYGREGRSITVTARDLGHEMGKHVHQEIYSNTELGQIVQDVAKRYRMQVSLPRNPAGNVNGVSSSRVFDFDPSLGKAPFIVTQLGMVPSSPREAKILKQVEQFAQAGRSDRAILHHIAARAGCVLRVEGKTIKFLPEPFAAPPRVVLRYMHRAGGLESFEVDENLGGKRRRGARGVKAVGIDKDTKKTFSSTATNESEKGRPVLGTATNFGAKSATGTTSGANAAPRAALLSISSRKGGAIVGTTFGGAAATTAEPKVGVVLPTPSGNPADADKHAASVHRRAESGGVKARAEVRGLSELTRLRQHLVVEITGVDKRDAGKYLVEGCTHAITLTDGYKVSLALKRQGPQKKSASQDKTGGKTNVSAAQSSGGSAASTKGIPAFRVSSRQGGKIVGVTTL